MNSYDTVNRDCPACGCPTKHRLELDAFPYGEQNSPERVWLHCHAVVQHCPRCHESFSSWETDAIRDAAVKVYKESLTAPPRAKEPA